MKKAFVGSLIGLGILLAVSNVSAASSATRCKLETTIEGFEYSVEGTAELSSSVIERLAVRVSAELKDGNVLVVQASAKNGDVFDIGSMSMLLGSATLQIDSVSDAVSPAFPVDNIKAIAIKRMGKIMAEGKCQPIPTLPRGRR